MALIAETIVEEYHNYLGYFTIRGVKKGSDEMDLLAIKVSNKNKIEALHIEVQVSHKPVRYISDFIAELHVAGRSTSHAANRTEEELRQCCQAWVKKKFDHPRKQAVRNKLFPNQQWKYILVHGNVRSGKELEILEELGVETVDIRIIIEQMISTYLKRYGTSSVGRDIINLFKLFKWEYSED
jgi:hypothetical protein